MRDLERLNFRSRDRDFNPRSPCGERLPRYVVHQLPQDFNPRSPCGERPETWNTGFIFTGISIHAPHAGSDKCLKNMPSR